MTKKFIKYIKMFVASILSIGCILYITGLILSGFFDVENIKEWLGNLPFPIGTTIICLALGYGVLELLFSLGFPFIELEKRNKKNDNKQLNSDG
jgi:hypothetical protein